MDEGEIIFPCRIEQDLKCKNVHNYWLSEAKYYSKVKCFCLLIKLKTLFVIMQDLLLSVIPEKLLFGKKVFQNETAYQLYSLCLVETIILWNNVFCGLLN